MEPLEVKLKRLTPEQRREVEEFVDFLLSRLPDPLPAPSPVPPGVVPPPLMIVQEPVRQMEGPAGSEPAPQGSGTDGGEAPFREIGTPEDRVAGDFMDYGQFEKQPSPADEAVRNVKERQRKREEREEREKPRVPLDWIE